MLPTLFLALVPQDAPKPVDPAVALERAKIAEETGDLAAAKAWLERAAQGADAALAASIASRISALRDRLGRGPQEAAPVQEGSSPVERRVREAIELLKQGPAFKEEAVKSIVWIGEPALSVLEDAIADPEIPILVRDDLLEAASHIGGEGVLSLLERMARSPDDLLRRKAVATLGSRRASYPTERWKSLLVDFLADRDPGVRRQALVVLREFPDAVQDQLDRLARDSDPAVRGAVVRFYGSVLSPETRDLLLRDPVTAVRMAFAEGMPGRSPDEAAVAVIPLLSDPAPEARTLAIRQLQGLDPSRRSEVQGALEKLVADPSLEVRRRLAEDLRHLLRGDAVPLLLRLVADPDVRQQAVRALNSIGTLDYRRDHLSLVCARMIEVAKSLPFAGADRPLAERGEADQYLEFFRSFVAQVATPEDFPTCSHVLVEVPEIAVANPEVVRQILEKARVEDLPLLCTLWTRLPPGQGRVWLVWRSGDLAGSAEGALPPCLLEVLAAALGPDQPARLRGVAVRAAIQARAALLVEPILAALAVTDSSLDPVIDKLRVMAETAPQEAARILVALAGAGKAGEKPFKSLTEWFDAPTATEGLARVFRKRRRIPSAARRCARFLGWRRRPASSWRKASCIPPRPFADFPWSFSGNGGASRIGSRKPFVAGSRMRTSVSGRPSRGTAHGGTRRKRSRSLEHSPRTVTRAFAGPRSVAWGACFPRTPSRTSSKRSRTSPRRFGRKRRNPSSGSASTTRKRSAGTIGTQDEAQTPAKESASSSRRSTMPLPPSGSPRSNRWGR